MNFYKLFLRLFFCFLHVFTEGLLILTRSIKSVESGHSVAVEHPEMAVVAWQQAGFAGGNHMITHNVATGSRSERRIKKKAQVSTFPWAPCVKSANSTSESLLSTRCLFLPHVQQQQKLGKTKRGYSSTVRSGQFKYTDTELFGNYSDNF